MIKIDFFMEKWQNFSVKNTEDKIIMPEKIITSNFPEYLYLNNEHYSVEAIITSNDNFTMTKIYEFYLRNFLNENEKVNFFCCTSRIFEDDYNGYQLFYSIKWLILRYINFNFENLMQLRKIGRENCLSDDNFSIYKGSPCDFDEAKDKVLQVLNSLDLFDTIDIKNIFMACMLDYNTLLKTIAYYTKTKVLQDLNKTKVLQDLNNGLFKINSEELKKILDVSKPVQIFLRKGESYKAFRLIESFLKSSSNNIKMIDNYLDSSILEIFYEMSEDITIKVITKKIKNDFKTAVQKYNLDRNNLEIKKSDIFHDRFIIIDDTKGVHLGPSAKDAGKKVGMINQINDVNEIIQKFNDAWDNSSTPIDLN